MTQRETCVESVWRDNEGMLTYTLYKDTFDVYTLQNYTDLYKNYTASTA